MKVTLKDLEKCFHEADIRNAKYLGVKIKVEGAEEPEIIINEKSNFDSKLDYYKNAYNENLTLKTYSKIRITGFDYGNTFGEIEKKLY